MEEVEEGVSAEQPGLCRKLSQLPSNHYQLNKRQRQVKKITKSSLALALESTLASTLPHGGSASSSSSNR